ncbi:hypothetical protein CONLIGDRAFT_440183 [Coniochaeta ligniaria NRRL 30616]|uniref:VWFA domain-containing protein n=1 Tax=Coniochaeta ligniaria NRRL 30616 TaxID=1408157 RepID=A0A1J7JCX5_9PEZI|nr:hypothetical protein CONLIGDRAFT_440183 [Coniochaeta ligniaria NRRL 30616]
MAVADLHMSSTSPNRHRSTNMSSNSGTGKRRSFLGSIKKLGRSASNKMGKPDDSSNLTMGNNNSTSRDGNPFRDPAPATRRPQSNAPPPSYIEALSGPDAGPAARAPRGPSPAPSGASALSVDRNGLSTDEDPYAFLSTFDTVFLIDDSGSMAGASWRETRDVLRNIAPVCAAHDADGIDVYFLNTINRGPGTNNAGGFLNIKSAEAVSRLFETVRPHAATPTGTRLNSIISPYAREFENAVKAHGGDTEETGVKPLNIIVITDGVPTDDPETILLKFAKKLDKIDAPPYQLGVQFFQVGNEPGAREALMELDDSLGKDSGKGVRDIVDTTTWNGTSGSRPVLTADGILKAVLGAVVKRLDRRRISLEQQRPNRLRP